MAFPILNISPVPFSQANPGYSGASAMNSLIQQMLANQNQRTANQFQAPTLQEQLLKMQNDNKLLSAQAAQAPERAQAELAELQAKPQKTLADVQEILKGRIPLERSQASEADAHGNLYNVQAKYTPLEAAIKATQALQTGGRFGNAYQLNKTLMTMDKASRDQWISNNQEAYNDMLSTIGNKGLANQSNIGTDTINSLMQKLYGISPQAQSSNATPAATIGQPQPQLPSLNTAGAQPQDNTAVPAAKPQVAFGSTPEQTKQMADITNFDVNRKMVGAQQNRRADAAVTLEKWLMDNREQYVPMIKNATQFAGLLGKGKSIQDAISQSSPQAYTDYQVFKTSFVPNLGNQMRMQETMGATDETSKKLQKMYEAGIDIDQNPAGATRMINQAIRMTQDVGDAAFSGAEPVHKGIYRKFYNLPRLKEDYLDLPEKNSGGASSGSVAKVLNGKTYTKINGQWYEQ